MCFLLFSHVGFVFQWFQHKRFSGVTLFIEIFRLNFCFFSTFLRMSSVVKFQKCKLFSSAKTTKLSWQIVSINVGCLRVFLYPKIGPSIVFFLHFSPWEKLGVAHGRIKKKNCIHLCHYVQLKSPSSFFVNLCLVKKYFAWKSCLFEIGFFRPVLLKNVHAWPEQLMVNWKYAGLFGSSVSKFCNKDTGC